MATNIFSTYSTAENRVTASVLAVLRSLSLERTERLIGALLGEESFSLVRFQDQVSAGSAGVPDGQILASTVVLIETKVRANTVDIAQLRRHLARLETHQELSRTLLVLTPDVEEPGEISSMGDDRVVWASFAMLDQAIDELLADPREVTSERESFLLRELQAMMNAEELVRSTKDVLVIAARAAWPEYERFGAYVCQPNRAFRNVSRLAFYTAGAIQPLVPRVERVEENVRFVRGEHDGALGELVEKMLKEGARREGESFKVLLLSAPDDPTTGDLATPVRNDLVAESGRVTAFTQGQRYVSWERLRAARQTSDLVD